MKDFGRKKNVCKNDNRQRRISGYACIVTQTALCAGTSGKRFCPTTRNWKQPCRLCPQNAASTAESPSRSAGGGCTAPTNDHITNLHIFQCFRMCYGSVNSLFPRLDFLDNLLCLGDNVASTTIVDGKRKCFSSLSSKDIE